MKNYIHIAIILFTSNLGWSQLFFNDAIVNIQNGGIMIIKTASLENSNNGSLQNAGQLIIEKDFINNGLTDGLNSNTGLFQIQENWINNNDFNADNSTVELYGNDQLITGTSVTDFYNLNLTGSGVKIMQINSKTEWLDLTSVELNTTNYIMEIHNPDVNAINRTSGFVSSTNDGHLQRWTNSTNDYLFPVGSSIGTFRYRPIIFTPYDNSLNIFGVRLANNNPSNDGYSIIKRDPTVESINNLYYHHLYQNQGNSEANVTFLYKLNVIY